MENGSKADVVIPSHVLETMVQVIGAPCDYENRFNFEVMKSWCLVYCGDGGYEDCWRKFFSLQKRAKK
jgi:hypothetical protein